MVHFPSIVIRQPQAQDIVDDPIQISSISTAFEGTIQIRVRAYNGVKIIQQFLRRYRWIRSKRVFEKSRFG